MRKVIKALKQKKYFILAKRVEVHAAKKLKVGDIVRVTTWPHKYIEQVGKILQINPGTKTAIVDFPVGKKEILLKDLSMEKTYRKK